MNAEDVSQLIRTQIGDRTSLPNSHGVDIQKCLIEPVRIKAIHRMLVEGKILDRVEQVWLVLEEDPVQKHGYKIVFSEDRQMFGLASSENAEDRSPSICGYYGDFPTTLLCM